ncbi:MAG: tRNA (adenosine(37)-N6)-threonylcarbamoyltransferase complex ATPase subunit type 1 TsaE [Pseudomonadota bacterium]
MILADAAATDRAGRILAPFVRAGDVIALSGDLGAGKTSFARGVLAGLGLAEEAPSPSFALVIPYAPPDVRLPVWHVDLYRLDDAEEVEQLGLDDALIDSALIIEWPERMGARLWPHALNLHFEPIDGGRRLTVGASPSWEARCPFQ